MENPTNRRSEHTDTHSETQTLRTQTYNVKQKKKTHSEAHKYTFPTQKLTLRYTNTHFEHKNAPYSTQTPHKAHNLKL